MSINDEREILVEYATNLLPRDTLTFTVDVPYRKKMNWLVDEVRKVLENQGRDDVSVTIVSESVIRLDA